MCLDKSHFRERSRHARMHGFALRRALLTHRFRQCIRICLVVHTHTQYHDVTSNNISMLGILKHSFLYFCMLLDTELCLGCIVCRPRCSLRRVPKHGDFNSPNFPLAWKTQELSGNYNRPWSFAEIYQPQASWFCLTPFFLRARLLTTHAHIVCLQNPKRKKYASTRPKKYKHKTSNLG